MRVWRTAQQRLVLEFATEGAVSQEEFKEQMTQFFAQMDQQDRCAGSFQSADVVQCERDVKQYPPRWRSVGVGLLPPAAARWDAVSCEAALFHSHCGCGGGGEGCEASLRSRWRRYGSRQARRTECRSTRCDPRHLQ